MEEAAEVVSLALEVEEAAIEEPRTSCCCRRTSRSPPSRRPRTSSPSRRGRRGGLEEAEDVAALSAEAEEVAIEAAEDARLGQPVADCRPSDRQARH